MYITMLQDWLHLYIYDTKTGGASCIGRYSVNCEVSYINSKSITIVYFFFLLAAVANVLGDRVDRRINDMIEAVRRLFDS